MFATRLLAVLFLLGVLQRKSLAKESYGYLAPEIFVGQIPCAPNPVPDLCSFEHQVPDAGKMVRLNVTSIWTTIGNMANVHQDSTNTSIGRCASSVQNFICTQTFLYICTDEYVIQNLEGLKKSCEKAERYCANFTNEQFPLTNVINCNFAMIEAVEPQKRRQAKCEHFPEVEEDPIPCEKRNYKVVVTNLTEQRSTLVAAHERLFRHAKDIKQECLDDVAEAICKSVAPACDRNETMAVLLLGRQECELVLSCLNTTREVKNLKEGFLEMCRTMPDAGTAEKVSLSRTYVSTTDHNTEVPTKTATENTWNNQTVRQNTSGNDSSEEPSPPTKRPYFNATIQNTHPAVGTENPPTHTNITELSTEKPTVNVTYTEKKTAKTVPTLKPTIESLQNLNATTREQNFSATTRDKMNASVLTKTPQIRATPSSCIVRVGSTSQVAVINITRHNETRENSTNAPTGAAGGKGKAAQLLIGFLLISTLYIYLS